MELPDRYLRALLDAAPDAMVITDHHGAIIFVNAQTETLFGYGREELVGKPVEILLPEQLRPSHPRHRLSYQQAPRVRPMGSGLDLRARRRDGSEFPVEISLSPLDTGQGLLVSSAIRDVSERRLVQQQLLAARNDADRANRAKSAFLAAASHDLRQPLQTLTLLAGVLERTVTGSTALKAVKTQREALESMADLLNSLLDISKLESGAIRPDVEDCSVREIFNRLKAAFAEQAEAKGLRFIVHECEDVVRSDPGLLEHMIQNLVANAIRYTCEGTVMLRCLHDTMFTRIEVQDTGIGIAAEDRDAIFEEFRQLGRKPGSHREGLGLGLAIVHRLSTLLGHPVEVESEPGRGSCFRVTVPRGGVAVRGQRYDTSHPVARRVSGLVLLVDDDPDVASASQFLFELEGHEVLVASCATEIARLIEQRARIPDVVVSDYHLGDSGTGIDAIAAVRSLAGRIVPAILVTGDTSAQIDEAVERVGHCRVLNKPVSPDRLLGELSQLLRIAAD